MYNILNLERLKKWSVVDWGYTETLSPENIDLFFSWLEESKNGSLRYLEGERAEIRKDLKSYFPECQSALVFLFSYKDTFCALNDFYNTEDSNGLKIASFAQGFEKIDYHYKIKDNLESIAKNLSEDIGEFNYKISLDTHPVLERELAHFAGLGYFGKSSMLIHPTEGSLFIIGSILIDQKLPIVIRPTLGDDCGECRQCIDSCPTKAIDGDRRLVDAKKCISAFSIEEFKDIQAPVGYKDGDGYIFGCDICLSVCPKNNASKKINSTVEEIDSLAVNFFLKREISEIILDLEQMSNRQFRKIFKGTSFERTGRVGLLKNLNGILS